MRPDRVALARCGLVGCRVRVNRSAERVRRSPQRDAEARLDVRHDGNTEVVPEHVDPHSRLATWASAFLRAVMSRSRHRHQHPVGAFQWAQHDFNRKFASILPTRREFDAGAGLLR